MPDVTGAGAATVVAGAAVLPVLQAAPAVVPSIVVLGYSIGLRADLLVAGFAGSVVALTFFNAVPSMGDTWRQLLATTLWRMWWCLASSLTAGYLAPVLLLLDGTRFQFPEQLVWSLSFLVGVGAQRVLGRFMRERLGVEPPGAEIAPPGGAKPPPAAVQAEGGPQ